MEIKTLADWPEIERELHTQIRLVKYNPDLLKMKRNIDAMLTELSKAEVEARRLKNTKYLQPRINDINIAIDKLEKWILVLLLSQ
jgi:DNA-binding transcriptional regulator GbsR (MarR family)